MGLVARVCVCIGVSGALVLSLFLTTSPASAQSALLDALSTRVTLTHPLGPAGEIAAEQIIRSGDTVATNETGRAVVTYADGSTAVLEENTALTIEFVQTSPGDYVVRMQQTLGRVWYAVSRAVALGSRYEVRSASMASVIRAGSDSYVTVSSSGGTTVVTISGTVETSAGGEDVTVPAGSATSVSHPGATPGPVHSAPIMALPSGPTPSPSITARNTPPTATPTAPTTQPRVAGPTSAFQPPVTTLPPLPVKTATPTPKTPPKPSVSTLTPPPAPTSTPKAKSTPGEDESGPDEDNVVRTPEPAERD